MPSIDIELAKAIYLSKHRNTLKMWENISESERLLWVNQAENLNLKLAKLGYEVRKK